MSSFGELEEILVQRSFSAVHGVSPPGDKEDAQGLKPSSGPFNGPAEAVP